jgi:lysophospholipase L1-like esterase
MVPQQPITKTRRRIYKILILSLVLGVMEASSRLVLSHVFPTWDRARRGLMGEVISAFQNTIGQSYLNYVATPGFRDEHGLQHNRHGYRGKLVPLQRSKDTLRIVCLGGSTTYGWGVHASGRTYPAQLEETLRSMLSERYRDVEVLNAGLPWATSAELLAHYHFKYHYYRPDVVVVHTAMNDAQAFNLPYYQPDYSHWRQQMPGPRPLPRPTRWLLHSRLASIVLVPALLGPRPEEPTFNRQSFVPTIRWFKWPASNRATPDSIPSSKIAFVHNVTRLVSEIKADGAIALLMPVEYVKGASSEPGVQEWMAATRNSPRYTEYFGQLLKQIGSEQHVTLVPFPHSKIQRSSWVDPMHLNGQGSKVKADHVAMYVEQSLGAWKPAGNPDPGN